MSQTVELCRECHNEIHRIVPSEKQLGREYHSLELLMKHPQILSFVNWVSKQK